MGKFDPFIPLAKQVVNKVSRGDGGLKIPSWYQGREVFRPTGAFRPGNAEIKNVEKGKGIKYNGEKLEKQVKKGQVRPGNKGIFQPPDTMPEDQDPYGGYYFALEISDGKNKNGIEIAHFQECSGLKSSTTIFEIEEGGLNAKAHKRPGQAKWENIVLKAASSSSTYLMAWRDQWLSDDKNWQQRTKFSGAITLYNNKHEPVKKYEFKSAWPVSWEGPAFNAGSSDLAVETLEIAHDGLVITDGKK